MDQTNKTFRYCFLGAITGVILFLLTIYDRGYILILYSIVTLSFLSVSSIRAKKALVINAINLFISSNALAWLLTIAYWGFY